MKVKDLRLQLVVYSKFTTVNIYDQDGISVFSIRWGRHFCRTKPQAEAIAKRLCDRFNAGQGGK